MARPRPALANKMHCSERRETWTKNENSGHAKKIHTLPLYLSISPLPLSPLAVLTPPLPCSLLGHTEGDPRGGYTSCARTMYRVNASLSGTKKLRADGGGGGSKGLPPPTPAAPGPLRPVCIPPFAGRGFTRAGPVGKRAAVDWLLRSDQS